MRIVNGKKNKIIITIGVIIIFAIVGWMFRDYFAVLPFPTKITLSSPSGVTEGKNGRLFVIDGGKKIVRIYNENGTFEKNITGGSLTGAFYYASEVCDDETGNIYITDVVYNGRGTEIGRERILRYDSDGRNPQTVYEIKYETGEGPKQYGNILSLEVSDSEIQLLVKKEAGISKIVLDADDKVSEEVYETDLSVNDATYDAENERVVLATRQGGLYVLEKSGAINSLYNNNLGESIPWKLDFYDGKVYYTDLTNSCICSIDIAAKEQKVVFENEYIPYTIDVSSQGKILTTDYTGIYSISEQGIEYFDTVPKSNLIFRIILWTVYLLIALVIVFAILRFLVKKIGNVRNKELKSKVLMSLTITFSMGFLVSCIILNQNLENQKTNTLREMNLFADILIDQIDTEKFASIKELSDYQSKNYCDVKENLDKNVDASYNNGLYYYYIIFVLDDKKINGVLDYEDTLTTRHPTYMLGDAGYTEAFLDGKEYKVVNDVSAYGTWSFVLKPVRDAKGDIIAVMEVGINCDTATAERNTIIKDIIITVFIAAAVIMMFVMEVTFLSLTWNKSRKLPREQQDISEYSPLRIIIFFMYVSDAMQDAFIAQLCSKLYKPIWNIPTSVASAFPISMELLMAAVFALVGGKIVNHIGTKKNLVLGFGIQLLGCIICAVTGNYMGILVGKTFMGVGMGLIYVTANTLAALSGDIQKSGIAFAGISAGVLSGITVGNGLGSIILNLVSYRILYLIGAAILFSGLVIASKGGDCKPSKSKPGEKLNIIQFLLNIKVSSFFLLILVPFMMALFYREYFFPLYAEENGITEVTIGRLFLLGGLIVLYFGPIISKWLIDKWGAQKAVIFSSLVMLMNLLLFAIRPSLATAVAAAVILSINISFAYTCQYTYFASLPVVEKYGEGKAMGVYSMNENVGQTLGPIVFGAALLAGFQNGILIIGILFGILLLLYIGISIWQNKK